MSFRGFVLFVLSGLLFISVLIAGLGVSSFVFLESGTYTPYIEKSGIYEQVAEKLPTFSENSTINVETSAKAIVNLLFTRVFSYINGETDVLNLTISIDSQEIRNTIKDEISALPVCEPGTDPVRDRVLCKPEGIDVDKTIEDLMNSQELSEIRTESIDLGNFIDVQGLSKVRDSVAIYRKAVYISVGLTLVWIGLILLIGWSRKRRGLMNLGVPITLAGTSIFLVFNYGSKALENLMSERLPKLSEFSIVEMFMEVIGKVSSRFITVSISLIIIGAILIFLAFFFAREEEKENKEKKDKRD